VFFLKTISIDVETFSSIDLSKSGVYRYCESPDFKILLFAYSIDGGEVQVIDLSCGEEIPSAIVSALSDPAMTKSAFNAQFERICLSRYLGMPTGTYLNPKGWHCTMIWSATLGLPLSLGGVGAVLGLEKQKLQEGKNLIKYFCIPCAATEANEGRLRNLPHHGREKWELFKAYNQRDVETEMGIQGKLSKFPVSAVEWDNYYLDQLINDQGIALDMEFVEQAILCDDMTKARLRQHMQNLTELENPNSVQQMKEWLADNGLETDSLGKAAVTELMKTAPAELSEVLSLRQELAKSSVKKYSAMQNVVGSDGRARGLIQFYGANRTGRFAGRLVQVQNLPQNHLPDLDAARNLIKAGLFDAVDLLYDSTSGVLSELIRTAFVPKDGSRFIVADFSAIEARIIAWLAGEKWRMEVFENGGDIYCASASKMFHVPVEKNGINGHLRQKGKISELSLGYGGSIGALKAMGALQMGVLENELHALVTVWRQSNPRIVKLWWDVDKAAMTAVKHKIANETHGIRFTYQSGMLFITLPSGRNLVYVKPRTGVNQFGSDAITYEGVGATKKWERIESYGPKFVENIVQAIARDILTEAMQRLSVAGYEIVMHCHDEVVLEVPLGESSVIEICRLMAITPAWANGLLLSADGYECEFYKKE